MTHLADVRAATTVACALAALLALTGCAATPERLEAGDADVAGAIHTARQQHIDAAQRKDLAGVLAIYAEDVTYVVPGADEARGRDAIAALEQRALAAADVLEARHTTVELRVCGDVAYELGTIEGPVRPRGGEASVVTFHFAALWQRGGDGTWRVRVFAGLPAQSRPPA